MSVIVVGGMISLGKTSMSELLGKELGSEVFYENVDNNDILPLFYQASEEEQEKYRYPFLLQLDFLNNRFSDIKNALHHKHNVIDRSIYEDWYFAKVNTELGNISQTEFLIYEKLLSNMMRELEELPKKSPDLMVYIKGSFETVMYRIGLRGREFEQDEALVEYYRKLWAGYDDWVYNHYNASQVLTIDADTYDFVHKEDDAQAVIEQVKAKLKQLQI